MRKRKFHRKRPGRKSSKSPTASNVATDRDWQSHCQRIFERAERAYRNGNTLALWDVVVFCEQANVPKPAWAREGLIKHAYELATGPQKKMGRRPDLLRDSYIYESVNYWCDQMIQPKGKGKPRHFSKRQACQRVKRELADQGVNLGDDAIKTAYRRAKKKYENGNFYYSPLFSDTQKSR